MGHFHFRGLQVTLRDLWELCVNETVLDARIKEVKDWREKMLARVRQIIHEVLSGEENPV